MHILYINESEGVVLLVISEIKRKHEIFSLGHSTF